MASVDRHIAVSAGWIAGPAMGVAVMALPIYVSLDRAVAGLAFWAGLALFLCSVLGITAHSLKEKRPDQRVIGPTILAALGICAVCGAGAWAFWPKAKVVPEHPNTPQAATGNTQANGAPTGAPAPPVAASPMPKPQPVHQPNRVRADAGAAPTPGGGPADETEPATPPSYLSLADVPDAERAAYRAKLQGFYVETDALIDKVTALPHDNQIEDAQRWFAALDLRAKEWIEPHMGAAAVVRYKTARQYMWGTPWTPEPHNNDILNQRQRIIDGLMSRRDNLQDMITGASPPAPTGDRPRSYNPALGS